MFSRDELKYVHLRRVERSTEMGKLAGVKDYYLLRMCDTGPEDIVEPAGGVTIAYREDHGKECFHITYHVWPDDQAYVRKDGCSLTWDKMNKSVNFYHTLRTESQCVRLTHSTIRFRLGQEIKETSVKYLLLPDIAEKIAMGDISKSFIEACVVVAVLEMVL